MIKAKYKALASEQENLKALSEQRDYVTVDSFSALCTLKGVDPKKVSKPKKRSFVAIQADRMCVSYPAKAVVASWFKLNTLPEDTQVSSQESTILYIERMYGIKAAVVNGSVVY
jgi:hypothetical protein